MSNSKLVTYTQLSPNHGGTRKKKITKIAIHHAATINASLVGLGNGFAKPSRKASSTYGIDSNGNVGMYVEEHNRPWTTGNDVDEEAVTIEVANSKGAPNWEVSDKALQTLIKLCIDICERNNIPCCIFLQQGMFLCSHQIHNHRNHLLHRGNGNQLMHAMKICTPRGKIGARKPPEGQCRSVRSAANRLDDRLHAVFLKSLF